jgi:sulfur transfer complex TusBCD TusB component (DsrH family)
MTRRKKSGGKLSTSEAAKKVLNLIESDMQARGLSEEEKDFCAGKFTAFVDNMARKQQVSRY